MAFTFCSKVSGWYAACRYLRTRWALRPSPLPPLSVVVCAPLYGRSRPDALAAPVTGLRRQSRPSRQADIHRANGCVDALLGHDAEREFFFERPPLASGT